MASAPRKRPRLHTALDIEDLRARLTDVDESNPEDLLAFKRALEAVVTDIPSDNIPTIAAAKLTRSQVFTFFGLKNPIVTKWGRSGYDIRPFALRPEFASNDGPSEWLTEALELWGSVFGRNNEADIRTYINLLIMDVIRDVQLFQADGLLDFAPRAKPSSSSVLPPSNNVIRAFNEVQVSTTLQVDGKQIRIVGRFDIGFSHAATSMRQTGNITTTPAAAGAGANGNAFTDTYLAVLETKGVRYDTESAFDQLLVYLAMVQRARAAKLKKTRVENGNCIVYGVLSDGDKFLFVCLDNDSMVYRSREFGVMNDLPDILQHLRHCLAVVATSSPTSSPRKIRIASRLGLKPKETTAGDVQEAADDAVGEEAEQEELDFAGLQKRVFHFKTGEYEERDILRWPKEE